MKRKAIMTIFVLTLLLGVVVADIVAVVLPPKVDETFDSNLPTEVKNWLNANNVQSGWSSGLQISNDDNTYKQTFCYTYNGQRNCQLLGLVMDYQTESKYCKTEGEVCVLIDDENPRTCLLKRTDCTEWANTPLRTMLQERYVIAGDEVLSRLYNSENKVAPDIVDVGNKTIRS